jgi:hypothetical protein
VRDRGGAVVAASLSAIERGIAEAIRLMWEPGGSFVGCVPVKLVDVEVRADFARDDISVHVTGERPCGCWCASTFQIAGHEAAVVADDPRLGVDILSAHVKRLPNEMSGADHFDKCRAIAETTATISFLRDGANNDGPYCSKVALEADWFQRMCVELDTFLSETNSEQRALQKLLDWHAHEWHLHGALFNAWPYRAPGWEERDSIFSGRTNATQD